MTTATTTDYKVKDIGLAEWGRREMEIAEKEMPGLMATRAKYGPEKPLQGVRVMGSLHMTIQTAVLIETLERSRRRRALVLVQHLLDPGPRCGGDRRTGVPVFAWKGETLEEYWWCTKQALTWPDGKGPQLIVDDGGDATLIIHRGYQAEDDPSTPHQADRQQGARRSSTSSCRRPQGVAPRFWHDLVSEWKGVSEETTTGVHRLYQMAERGELLVPAINVNDSVTKSKFDNIYGCRESLVDGIKRATDVMISGKVALICGFGDVGKGSAESLAGQRAQIWVTEIDPICALQACMAGYKVKTVEEALPHADIYVTTTGNKDIITAEHMSRMKDQAIVCNIGHFDNEIQVDALEAWPGVVKETIKPQVDKYTFPDGHSIFLLAEGRLVNLGCATGHPSFVMSNSFTNQVLAQIDLWQNEHEIGVTTLSKKLDEEVARLHLDQLGAKLTTLSQEQADYIDVPVEGPYKPDWYRY